MKNKIIILFVALITQNAIMKATEPAHNPKQPELEYCKFLPKLIADTTKQSDKEKNLQKKQELNKNIANWKNQLETGKCKEVEEKNCKEIKTTIDSKEDLLKRAKFTKDGFTKENQQIDQLKDLYKKKNCK